MTNIRILPWHTKSMSAKALAKGLGVKLIMLEGSTYNGDPKKVIINYGNSKPPEVAKGSRFVNTPKAISAVSDKAKFFALMAKAENPPRVPPNTQDVKEATAWIAKGKPLVGRTVLNGHSGNGIIFSTDVPLAEFLKKSKLFVMYKKKTEEYRVHIAFGKVIDIQRKVLRKEDDKGRKIDPKTIDFRVRSHQNGFIFVRGNINPAEDVTDQAMLAMKASGLHFGAVDVIWNDQEQKAYVLEINTAPGLEGTTLENYINVFRENILEKNNVSL